MINASSVTETVWKNSGTAEPLNTIRSYYVNNRRGSKYNLRLRSVRATIVTVEKLQVLHIASVYL